MNSELTSKVIDCYKSAYSLTHISLNLPEAENKLTRVQLALHKLYMETNPYALMTPVAIDKVLLIIKEEDVKDFFIRLASRFFFLLNPNTVEVTNLYGRIWLACNVHASVAQNSAEIGPAVNKLGYENAEQQLTRYEAISLLNSNRWYAVFCLFTLIYTGT